MDEEQQIIQEPVQEPAPEKQSDKTQAILTAVSPLVRLSFRSSAGVNIIPPLICWLVWKDANLWWTKGKEYSGMPRFPGRFIRLRPVFHV